MEPDDAYMFISEFEEVCVIMKIQQLSDDAVKLRFIPFALRDNAKKWLYSLTINSITTWAEFVAVFLKKFFPMHKTARIRSEISQFRQYDKEPFWRYLERFKDLLAQCPHHAIKKWRLCQIIYEGIDYNSKILLESMSHGDFMRMTDDAAWIFLEEMVEKTIQWEGFNEKPPTTNSTTTLRSGIHSIKNSITTEAKMTTLMRRTEVLESKGTPQQFDQVNQTYVPSCFNCQSLTHVMKDCPFLPNPLMNSQGQ